MNFIAFDLETTGTVAGVNSIVEIGAVRFTNDQVDSFYATLVDPGVSMPPAASAVNGITDSMLKGKPKIQDLLESFTQFCEDLPLLAHNASFDAQFLLADFKKHEILAPKGIVLDSLSMARKIIPGLPNYKLGTLVQHFKIPMGNAHRAQADAEMAGRLFIELKRRVSVGGQAAPLETLVSLTGKAAYFFPLIERKPKQLDFLSM
jgi:DNA polymerase III subunit epsilon